MNKHWPHKGSKYVGKKHEKRDTPNLGLEPIIFFREEDNKMSKFWELLKESTITQAAITIILTVTVCYMAGTGQPIPDLIAYGFMSALSFFLGAKTQQILRR